MGNRSKTRLAMSALLAIASCTSEPRLIASNCDDPKGCVKAEPLKIDAVDILLVIDDSASIASSAEALKQELPRMLNAITTGDGEGTSFPPAGSVHVAVTTSDMGSGGTRWAGCEAKGRDGLFVKPGEVGLSCQVSYPGYLAFNGGPAAIATVDTVACVPLVFPSAQDVAPRPPAMEIGFLPTPSPSKVGCGFEQPLEAALKAMWPTADSSVQFVTGHGQGEGGANAGFLRQDSLLLVIVVSDEDDCSTTDYSIFGTDLSDQPVNLRCYFNQDKLFDASRYVENWKRLRPGNDNVIFALIGGVPAEFVSEDYRAGFDFASEQSIGEYYDSVLQAPAMQDEPENPSPSVLGALRPSCTVTSPDGTQIQARPPRRLIQVAKRFGTNSVVGSLCSDDFGANTGRIIRAIGERLSQAAAVGT